MRMKHLQNSTEGRHTTTFFIVGVNSLPRNHVTRLCHSLDGNCIAIPVLQTVKISNCQFPTLLRLICATFQTRLLGLLADIKEQFHHMKPVGNKHPLKLIDFLNTRLIQRFTQIMFDKFNQ